MKRLIKLNKYIPCKGDIVIFYNHPYDRNLYTVKDILPNGNVFIENDSDAYTNINPKNLKLFE